MARQVAILEEDGFLTRTPSPSDKRTMELYPTEKTLSLLPHLQPLLHDWEACLTADLSEAEKSVLEKLLGNMKEKATAWVDDH